MGRGDDEIVVEFVMERGTVSLYIHDEAGKPMATKNVTGTLTLVSPQRPGQGVKLAGLATTSSRRRTSSRFRETG